MKITHDDRKRIHYCNPKWQKKQELTIETVETADFKTNEMTFRLRCADKGTR